MTKEVNAQIVDSALQKGWRLEAIFHLGGMTADDAYPTAFEDAVDEDIEDVARVLGVSAGRAATIDRDALFEFARLKGKFGFLVQAATPVRTYLADTESYSASWNHYRSKWFYVEELGAAVPAIETWVAKECADDRRRSERDAQ
ncbi:hypothetical protein VI03_24970 [Burkholderia vietnamiensis]|uniref:hypothetical protein n=1 Tax=Burkholderia vietnamiensis TaxID=60552 RepID=UPI0006222437|nr:hypothetical protein [Burkholderia vietnamiensis]KKI36034.1 hypothetical protein VI03_24970 [Burkholderia vietnamiensis]MBR8189210.1 hypothetical protein [Burkholderia vietnamiensis]HDR9174417.1 hypothetical protein [Burkholderia vietnamiensis]